jgi:hypothetical protein
LLENNHFFENKYQEICQFVWNLVSPGNYFSGFWSKYLVRNDTCCNLTRDFRFCINIVLRTSSFPFQHAGRVTCHTFSFAHRLASVHEAVPGLTDRCQAVICLRPQGAVSINFIQFFFWILTLVDLFVLPVLVCVWLWPM